MRDAMKAAVAAGRFKDIGFDPISLRSENRLRIGLDSVNPISPAYAPPSVIIMKVGDVLERLRDARNTALALAAIK